MLDLQELNRELQENEARINKNFVTQHIINSLFHLSQGELPLQGILGKAVDLILTLPWLVLESAGCIHLVEGEPDILVMKAQKGMEVPVRETCARLPFGKCLCGVAALTRKVQFAAGIDEHHKVMTPKTASHGHYCVPITMPGGR